MSAAVFVEGLSKAYHGKTVVNHLNLSVKSGTVFGLLGANGAGKSTTIECMLGTKQADSGTVRLLGQDPKKERFGCQHGKRPAAGLRNGWGYRTLCRPCRPVLPVGIAYRPISSAVSRLSSGA